MKKIIKSESEWRAQLSELAFHVTRNAGTEKPFSSNGFSNKIGSFNCVCCNSLLFKSAAKYESGSGWPSFFDKAKESNIITTEDNSFSMRRIEVSCGTCDAHLGHVFPDGPKPTGLRYCINGCALVFQEE